MRQCSSSLRTRSIATGRAKTTPAGFASLNILPSFKTPAVQVLTLYPGMPTEIMERDITNRIERWTSQSEGSLVFDLCRCCGVATLKDHVQAGHNEDG